MSETLSETATEKGKKLIAQKSSAMAYVKEPIFAKEPLRHYSGQLVMSDMSKLELRVLSQVRVNYRETQACDQAEAIAFAIAFKSEQKESTMIDKTIPFQQVSYVYGNIASDCSDADLIAALKRISSNIKDLQDVAVLGADKYAASRIKSLEEQKEQVLSLLEKR